MMPPLSRHCRQPWKALPWLAVWFMAAALTGCAHTQRPGDGSMPGAARYLVPLADCAPSILQEMRYAGADNFVGRPVEGYAAPVCLLTPPAARALARAQEEVRTYDLSLKVFDCYRPQRSVDHFVRWAQDTNDQQTKARFYPDVDKRRLFERGYIAARSGHSRGSTVDITLVSVADGDSTELAMGTPFDFFDPRAHTASTAIPPAARRNRLLLRLVMERHGFVNYEKEWWHYTLRKEPWPDRYFDFPVVPFEGNGRRCE
jgi:D-alanyl-D-alanine dipeptidase